MSSGAARDTRSGFPRVHVYSTAVWQSTCLLASARTSHKAPSWGRKIFWRRLGADAPPSCPASRRSASCRALCPRPRAHPAPCPPRPAPRSASTAGVQSSWARCSSCRATTPRRRPRRRAWCLRASGGFRCARRDARRRPLRGRLSLGFRRAARARDALPPPAARLGRATRPWATGLRRDLARIGPARAGIRQKSLAVPWGRRRRSQLARPSAPLTAAAATDREKHWPPGVGAAQRRAAEAAPEVRWRESHNTRPSLAVLASCAAPRTAAICPPRARVPLGLLPLRAAAPRNRASGRRSAAAGALHAE